MTSAADINRYPIAATITALKRKLATCAEKANPYRASWDYEGIKKILLEIRDEADAASQRIDDALD